MSDLNLEFGRTYSDYERHYIKMKTEVSKDDPKYKEGFRFVGSNGAYYRPNGTSLPVGDLNEDVTDEVNDIVLPEGRVVDTQKEALSLGNQVEHKAPHGWIQWKGTDVCMDLHCRCGHHGHIDGDFVYFIECPACHRTYALNPNIELIEFTGPVDPKQVSVKIADNGIVEEQ